jgi:sugar phosphate isomerase/epimerase
LAAAKEQPMGRLKVGAFLSSFRLDFKSALAKAREIGLQGLEFSSLRGEIDIEKIAAEQAKDIVKKFKEHNLIITSICGDIGGFALEDEQEANARVERTFKIMEITKRLGSNIVQTHIGHVPEDFATNRKTAIMKMCLEKIGKQGEKTGVYLATETGPEPGSTMKKFLDTIGIPTIKVNYDPANLAMKGFDPIAGVQDLKDYIIHTHAKDGRKTPDEKGRKEQPLGKGDVNFPKYIQAMDAIGYQGFYVIERECGDNPADDIAAAKTFLDQF